MTVNTRVFLNILLIILFNFSAKGHDTDSLLIRAWQYYEYEEPELALKLVFQHIEHQGGSHSSFILAGDCYAELEDFSAAFDYYSRALAIDSSYSDIYYKLGNLYDRKNHLDSAVHYFRIYTEMEPYDINGYIRVAILYLDSGKYNEALHYAEIASFLEPRNAYPLYILGMVKFAMELYTEVYTLATEAFSDGIRNHLLLKVRGLALFNLSDFKSAYNDFTEALELKNNDIHLLDLKARAQIMKNTESEDIKIKEQQKIRFAEYSSLNLQEAFNLTRNPDNPFYFRKLSRQFYISPESFGLMEFYMFYIGYDPNVLLTPRNNLQNKTIEFLEDGNYQKAIETARVSLKNDPTSIDDYWYLSVALLLIGDYENYYINIYRYYGFIEAIKASGDGTSAETAFVINNTEHTYTIFKSLDYIFKSMLLTNIDSSKYYIVSGIDRSGNEIELFFNIDIPYL